MTETMARCSRWGVFGALVTCATVSFAGCQQYMIDGKVIAGDFSTVAFVDADDPRLAEPPVTSAEVLIRRDPDRPGQRESARVFSGGDGTFTITLDEFGAGWMNERWEIVARKAGYRSVEIRESLPAADAGQVLLIELAPGQDQNESWQDQYERFR